MKILIVSAYYLPHLGGVENYVFNLARELVSAGNNVTILTTKHDKKLPSTDIQDEQIDILRLDSHQMVGNRFPIIKKTKQNRELLKRMDGTHYDAIVINTRYYGLSRLGAKIARRQGVRPIVIDHSSSWLSVGNKLIDPIIRAYESIATHSLSRFHPRYFGVSQDSVRWLKRFGIHGEGVLNNAIDIDRFSENASIRSFRTELGLDEETPVVTFVGRLLEEKGTRTILDLSKETESDGIHYVIAGVGPDLAYLEAHAPSNLHLLGRIDSSDVAALLKETEIFCHPSYYPEGFPTCILEAAASGCALVISDNAGSRELIPDKSYGRILPIDSNPEDYKEAILDILENPPQADKAKNRVKEQFSWQKTAQNLIAALDDSDQ